MNPLSSLLGVGGGLSAGGGTATSGDASAGIKLDFTSNNAFSVGGSGEQKVNAATSTGETGGTDKTLLYAGIGIVGLVAIIGAIVLLKD